MVRVRLIHSNEVEATTKAEKLVKAGYIVDFAAFTPDSFRALKRDPPDALVIDLTRLPSHGRDIAVAFRTTRATRHVPLVFVEGDPEKVARVRELLPDAEFTIWSRIRSAVKRAIENPPVEPVVPKSNLAGYSHTPLPKKLGIKPNSTVALINAPDGLLNTLGGLPDQVTIREHARGRNDLIIWFPKSCRDLEKRVARMGELAGAGGMWVAWAKASSGVPSDMTQAIVRKTGLAAGLVDYKICAIDSTWSALRFTRRRSSS